jgi:hypothetical protein
MKKETVIHIPEKGCHNCRLYCVNHKKCDSPYPCKQGMGWRPIVQFPTIEKLIEAHGFDSLEELTKLIVNLDLSSLDKIKEFKEWQAECDSKKGLLKLKTN